MDRELKIIIENCPQNHKCPAEILAFFVSGGLLIYNRKKYEYI